MGAWSFEIFQKYSHDALVALQNDLFDTVTFYFNALERETDQACWDLIQKKQLPIIAIRALSGGLVDPANADRAGQPGKPLEMLDRRQALTDLFQKSGCESWQELSVRYLASHPHIHSCIVGTTSEARLLSNIDLFNKATPLPANIVAGITDLHNNWAQDRQFDPNSPWK